jgi:hypothetical protein
MLQLLIAATGNYGFFNLLALVLCLTLIDDWAWRKFKPFRKEREIRARFRWPWWIVTPLMIVLVFLSLIAGVKRLGASRFVPDFLETPGYYAEPFQIANSYGLFADMTTERRELIFEGSNDGNSWLPYEFKWKPGAMHRRPRFCSPGMPRLDWQMWFAALDPDSNSAVVLGLLDRIKDRSAPVLSLLASNPFPDKAPTYLRVVGYDYRFTTPAERARSGDWWARQEIGALRIERRAQ